MAVPDWVWVLLMLSVEVHVSTELLAHLSPDGMIEEKYA
jgi:hypothetical protein